MADRAFLSEFFSEHDVGTRARKDGMSIKPAELEDISGKYRIVFTAFYEACASKPERFALVLNDWPAFDDHGSVPQRGIFVL